MGVTALLQQFLKLRAFILKPYLHLQEMQQSLGQINIKPVPSIIILVSRSNIKINNKTTAIPKGNPFTSLQPSPFLYYRPTRYLAGIPTVLVILGLNPSLGFKAST